MMEDDDISSSSPSSSLTTYTDLVQQAHGELVRNDLGLTDDEVARLLRLHGPNEPRQPSLCSLLMYSLAWSMGLLLWCAVLVAILEGWATMAAMLVIQLFSSVVGVWEQKRVLNVKMKLQQRLMPQVSVRRRKNTHERASVRLIEVSGLVPGDCLIITPGSTIRADCLINHGTIAVDQRSLTGDSAPVQVTVGDNVFGGTLCVRGEATGTVMATGSDAALGGLSPRDSLPLAAPEKLQLTISRLLRKVTLVIVCFCVILFAVLMSEGEFFAPTFSFIILLFAATSPMGMDVTAFNILTAGAFDLQRSDIVVRNAAGISMLASMNVLCLDSQGLVNSSHMKLLPQPKIYMEGETLGTLLRFAAMASKWNEIPRHEVDKLILGSYLQGRYPSLQNVQQLELLTFRGSVERTEATVIEDGKEFKVFKGSARYIAGLCDSMTQIRLLTDAQFLMKRGIQAVAIARTMGEGDMRVHMLGLLTFDRYVLPDVKESLVLAQENGIQFKLMAGQGLYSTMALARELGLGDAILDAALTTSGNQRPHIRSKVSKFGKTMAEATAFANVDTSARRYCVVASLRYMGYKCGIAGESLDSSTIKRAHVSISLGKPREGCRRTPDMIQVRPGFRSLLTGVLAARQVYQQLQNFVMYRLYTMGHLLLFMFIAVLSCRPHQILLDSPTHTDVHRWPQFFTGSALLLFVALINFLPLLVNDPGPIPTQPLRWDFRISYLVASAMGLVGAFSSLLLLFGLLESWHPHGWLTNVGLIASGGLSYGQINMAVFLQLSVSQLLALYSCRSGSRPFFCREVPFLLVLVSLLCVLAVASLAAFWPDWVLDKSPVEGLGLFTSWVLVYCLLWFIVQDLVKVAACKLIARFHVYGYGKPLTLRGVDLSRLSHAECRNHLCRAGFPVDIAEIIGEYYHEP